MLRPQALKSIRRGRTPGKKNFIAFLLFAGILYG
jgi:hypothetical protein